MLLYKFNIGVNFLFQRAFTKRQLVIDYYSAEGLYKIWPLRHNTITSGVELHLFLFLTVPEHHLVRRMGIKYRLLPPLTEQIHSFPVHLINSPLNWLKLSNVSFPAPREGIELQKYHYTQNWWQEIRPKRCSKSQLGNS